MTRAELRAFVIGGLFALTVALGAMAWHDATLRTAHARELKVYRGLYLAAKTAVRRDSVEVVKYVTRTRTLRDTVLENLTDTLKVKEYVYQTDTLREKCMACIASASALGRLGDSTIAVAGADRRRWYDRIGVGPGYGILFDRQSGVVRHGPTLTLTVRLWP